MKRIEHIYVCCQNLLRGKIEKQHVVRLVILFDAKTPLYDPYIHKVTFGERYSQLPTPALCIYDLKIICQKCGIWRGIPTRSLREENAIDGSTAVDPQRGILAPVARKHVLASTHQCICWARRVGGRVHFYGSLRLFSCQEGRLDGIRPI